MIGHPHVRKHVEILSFVRYIIFRSFSRFMIMRHDIPEIMPS